MGIGAPIIIIFLLRLTPGIIATIFLGRGGTDIPARPFRARRKAKVDGFSYGTFVLGFGGTDNKSNKTL